MSFAQFARRYLLEQAAQQQGNTPPLPPVPAYQGPIRQDLNLFELTGQTMGAPAVPLSTEAQALAQLANFMALRQQAQGGAAPPVLGPLAEMMERTPNTLGSSVPMPPLPEPGPRSTYAMPPASDAMAQAIRNQAAVRAAQDTLTTAAPSGRRPPDAPETVQVLLPTGETITQPIGAEIPAGAQLLTEQAQTAEASPVPPRSTYAMPPAVDRRRYAGQILGGPQPEPPPSPPPAPGTNVPALRRRR